MENNLYLKLAIDKSQESFEKGFFPAGAVIVLNGKILSSKTSNSFPGYNHAEYNAIDEAFAKSNSDLSNAVLYTSMEPCLMCMAKAYWAGIRKIVFAIGKESMNKKYYEGAYKNKNQIESLNEKMEFLQVRNMEKEALKIVETWENSFKTSLKK
ncbi:MAG: nucleoside deaminase [Patescibacteria group bacterium]